MADLHVLCIADAVALSNPKLQEELGAWISAEELTCPSIPVISFRATIVCSSGLVWLNVKAAADGKPSCVHMWCARVVAAGVPDSLRRALVTASLIIDC
jgi:hypothetical protein